MPFLGAYSRQRKLSKIYNQIAQNMVGAVLVCVAVSLPMQPVCAAQACALLNIMLNPPSFHTHTHTPIFAHQTQVLPRMVPYQYLNNHTRLTTKLGFPVEVVTR